MLMANQVFVPINWLDAALGCDSIYWTINIIFISWLIGVTAFKHFFSSSTGLVGILLPHKQEEAYSVLRMSSGVGYAIGYGLALFFNTQIQLWVALGLIIFTIIGFSILTITQTKRQLFHRCFKNVNKLYDYVIVYFSINGFFCLNTVT